MRAHWRSPGRFLRGVVIAPGWQRLYRQAERARAAGARLPKRQAARPGSLPAAPPVDYGWCWALLRVQLLRLVKNLRQLFSAGFETEFRSDGRSLVADGARLLKCHC